SPSEYKPNVGVCRPRTIANPFAQSIATNASDLTLPIRPASFPGFQPVITFSFNRSPEQGLRLAESIAMNIYYAWKDMANLPLTEPISDRQLPFDEFEFLTRPSFMPGTELTPVKIGLASCWIMHDMLQLDRWPGHTLAVIFEGVNQQRREIGFISIENRPLILGPDPADPVLNSSSSSSSSSTQFSPPQDIRRVQRWLRCFRTVVQFSIVHSPQDRVTDDPSISPKPEAYKYPFPCGTAGVADRLDLFIYPAANAGSPQQLTWQKLMSFLLHWIIKVARNQEGGKLTRFVEDGVLVAEISVYLQ
ncbi:MAG: hypothetical protein Q9184_007386, partial [Pyrenodesmia sp. 2 TL-2023]